MNKLKFLVFHLTTQGKIKVNIYNIGLCTSNKSLEIIIFEFKIVEIVITNDDKSIKINKFFEKNNLLS